MQNIINKTNTKWIKPWEKEKFDELYERDERYFSILIKGVISWLNRNIVLYGKPINHFIFNTGSSYMYVESNGYEFKWNEVTGEDQIYMHMPRCLIEIQDINVPMEELSQGYARGIYERQNGNNIDSYSAEIKRIPIELNLNLKYVLSNFNESIVLLQELIDKIIFQKYFNIVYLGKSIQCSIEYSANFNTELNKIDMSSPETNQKNITLTLKICSSYPVINESSSIYTDTVIKSFGLHVGVTNVRDVNDPDYVNYDNIIKTVE